jgi:hypothetical protein
MATLPSTPLLSRLTQRLDALGHFVPGIAHNRIDRVRPQQRDREGV